MDDLHERGVVSEQPAASLADDRPEFLKEREADVACALVRRVGHHHRTDRSKPDPAKEKQDPEVQKKRLAEQFEKAKRKLKREISY